MPKRLLLLLVVLAILVLTFSIFSDSYSNTIAAQVSSCTNNTVIRPEFALPDVQGNIHSIKEWDGKYIVLNFWATWCAPCREEIPEFIKLQEEYGASNLQFIGVAIDDAVSVDSFSLEMGINYPNLIAEAEGIELAKKYANITGALPYSVIINPNKEIIFRHVGLLNREKILDVIQLTKG